MITLLGLLFITFFPLIALTFMALGLWNNWSESRKRNRK